LVTAHIRYQGLRGTVPISLDARNLPTLLALREIAPWREAGGLIVSASLGAPAALEGVGLTPNQGAFPARRLVQDALLAGSDVLRVTDFALTNNPDAQVANIVDAILFFRERYADDANFRAAINRAVRNIIRAKIKVYGEDLLAANTQKPIDNIDALDDVSIDLDQIARQGVTLITPLTQEGGNPLAGPPQPNDNILIITDSRIGRDCPTCPTFPLIETTALQQIILERFGPNTTGQISPDQISSISFVDLKAILEAEGGAETGDQAGPDATDLDVEGLITAADWIIFAMLDLDLGEAPQSDAVRVLLRNRYDTIRSKTLILFSFNAPYFLDETEISQLTAYYAFYSKETDYLEGAGRLLFQQFEPSGASPVAIPAIGPLDLNPDPNQTIQLEPVHWVDTNGTISPINDSEGPLNTIDLAVGESILFRTSVIMDRNGNPVPDGTSVNFFRSYPQEGLPLEPLTAETTNGVAEITIFKERDTPLVVSVSSDLAVQAVPFNIGPGIVDTPTPTPTLTPLPTNTPMPTETPGPTDTP
ncbi:MAG: hypothetical protein R3264_22665, partial [Anaerolineae bacterium]|nr:hypothetical protein [Anaerolineae bacterium]